MDFTDLLESRPLLLKSDRFCADLFCDLNAASVLYLIKYRHKHGSKVERELLYSVLSGEINGLPPIAE